VRKKNHHFMKLLVTGINGFVGGGICKAAPEGWELHGVGRSENALAGGVAGDGGVNGNGNGDRVKYHRLDLTNAGEVERVMLEVRPDVVVHAAAIANIDFCEKNREEAEAINVTSAARVARVAREIGARVVFCSTDTVFDGKRGMYGEGEAPQPVNFYGETKVRAERVVLEADPRNVVARVALVMGFPVVGEQNTFLRDILGKLERGEAANFAYNEVRSPIDVLTLGEALVELAGPDCDFAGIIHLSSSEPMNRYDMARRIAVRAGYSADRINSVNSDIFPGRAPRPDDASLDNSLARQVLKTPMLNFDDSLERCFGQLKHN
jgi:dTDP-4-dehydrorhamnose reductase